jgi:choline dehydrogenase-like flavoprotein
VNHYDVIIVGSGAGGGTLAHRLAPSGKRVLIVERGEYLRREADNWSSRAVNVDAKYHTREVWSDRKGKPLHPHTHYYVGGNTKFYGAALFRLRREDFGELRHEDGISPAWPITYDDIEPYYTIAERLYRVHGERGVDPTEPPASAPYPYPAITHEPRIQQLHDALERQGLHPFHTPLGIMLDEQSPRTSKCIRCATCDGYGCIVNAKSDAQVICVDPALEYANVELLTGAFVSRLETSASGRTVTGVRVERNGTTELYTADIVVLSCGAINSAALLLRSASDAHPNGLANSSDCVGRHYMGHVNSVQLAISRTPNPTVFQKTLALNDFYFGAPDSAYPLGHISFVGKLDAIALSAGAPAFVPNLTLDVMARHSLDFWLTSEDLPDPENRVTIDRNGGIVLQYAPNNDAAHRRLIDRLHRIVIGCDCTHLVPRQLWIGQRIPLAGVAHQNGTCRFGHDPATSVLDVNCKAHDVDNLYVVDASFFPSSGAVNPALTVMANALRIGDHLLERLGALAPERAISAAPEMRGLAVAGGAR